MSSEASWDESGSDPSESVGGYPCEWAEQGGRVGMAAPQRASVRSRCADPESLVTAGQPQPCVNQVTERLLRATEKLVLHSHDSETDSHTSAVDAQSDADVPYASDEPASRLSVAPVKPRRYTICHVSPSTMSTTAPSALFSPPQCQIPTSDSLLSSATNTTPATPHSRAISPLFAYSPIIPRAPPSVAVSLASVSRDLAKMP